MKLLITGGAGFVGTRLARTLLARGALAGRTIDRIVLADQAAPPPDLAAHAAIESRIGALLDQCQAWRDEAFDGVFHLAGQPGVRASFGPGFEHYVERNVRASGRLFEAAARRGVRVVFASSSSIYGDAESYPTREDALPRPISPYGVTKLCADHLAYAHARTSGLETVGLRYFTVYGPRQRPDMAFHRVLRAQLCEQEVVLYDDGTQTRDFTFVDDVVAANLLALERGERGAAYNIGGG